MRTIQLPAPMLLRVAIKDILIPNGQSENTDGRAELSTSLGESGAATLIQPPVVEDLGDGTVRLIAGGRRVRAAGASGWDEITCLVYPKLDPVDAQFLRVMENLTHLPMQPLDEMQQIRLAFLAANAEAMGRGDEARSILQKQGCSASALESLTGLLAAARFDPEKPAVSWDEILTRLGFTTDKGKRKRFLALASLRADLLGPLSEMKLNESKLRAIGGLPEKAQGELVAALQSDPDIAKLLTKIAKLVGEGASVTAAIAESESRAAARPERGTPRTDEEYDPNDGGAEVGDDEDGEWGEGGGRGEFGDDAPDSEEEDLFAGEEDAPNDVVQQSVATLVESAQKVEQSLKTLRATLGKSGLMELPEPWGEYVAQSLERVQKAVKGAK